MKRIGSACDKFWDAGEHKRATPPPPPTIPSAPHLREPRARAAAESKKRSFRIAAW